MFRIITLVIAAALSGCSRQAAPSPTTSAEATQLRWLDHADVAADVREHVERQRDTRFVSVYGFSTPTAFGLEDTPETRELIRRHGERPLEGTGDVINNSEQLRLRGKAQVYAKQYNIRLLQFLREHPGI